MTTVGDIFSFLNGKAPVETKMDFDNVGLLVGHLDKAVSRVLTALDITDEVIEEAARLGAELIVSHHPLFFVLKTVTDADWNGQRVLALAEKGIAAVCMHTNLDAAEGGVNDALMTALGGQVTGVLEPGTGIGRIGTLPCPMAFSAFLAHVKSALCGNGLRYHDAGRPVEKLAVCGGSGGGELGLAAAAGCDTYVTADVKYDQFLAHVKSTLHGNGLRYHDAGRPVEKLAVCGGSGGGELGLAAAAGCDTYVTADVKYDQFLTAKHLGLNLIDADHFCTENVVVPVLAQWLEEAFPTLDVRISAVHGQTAQFY